MNTLEPIDILMLRANCGKPFDLRVSGTSMHPILHDGDTITVCRRDSYQIGDILVFLYKDNTVLVHRLLKIQNGRYFCKGDNAFRLEDITDDQIVGAVQLNDDSNKTDAFITASLQISKIFRKCGYDTEMVKQTSEYLAYAETYLENHHEISKEQQL